MEIKFVRQSGEIVENKSDFIPFRYAYGGQNGYVKGYGSELDYIAIGNQFTLKSGRVVLDGVESDIDANHAIFTVYNISETRYYTLSYIVNLGNETATIELQQGVSTYPTVERGADLTEDQEGVARLLLYRFTATGGIISNVEKIVKEIGYGGEALNDYDISKGTIEQRFKKLGFKGGSVPLVETVDGDNAVLGTQYGIATLKRQGNYVIVSGEISINQTNVFGVLYNGGTLATLPEKFRPAEEFSTRLGALSYSSNEYDMRASFELKISTDGTMYITKPFTGQQACFITDMYFQVGYEAKPL